MTPLAKYIWLIELLQKSAYGLTFKEINEKWLESRRNTKDKNISIEKRTFHNHIKAIREEYGIHIACGPGYRYYIEDSDKNVCTKVELLSVLNMLSETVADGKLNKSLYVEDYFDLFRDEKVKVVMDAIKTRHKVRLANMRNIRKPDKYLVLTIAPYQLHYISSKWYIIGQTDEFGLMRIPLSYYRGSGRITDVSYNYPSKYTEEEYCKMIYGISNESVNLTIKISRPILDYDKYPLMPFQQNVEYTSKLTHLWFSKYTPVYSAIINFELPKSAFALYTLKNKLVKYHYKVMNDVDPFELFTEEQYNEAMSIPVIL